MRTSTFLLYILDATVDHANYVVRLQCNEKEFGTAFNDAGQGKADQLDLSCRFPTYPAWEAMVHHEIERGQMLKCGLYILEKTVDPGTCPFVSYE